MNNENSSKIYETIAADIACMFKGFAEKLKFDKTIKAKVIKKVSNGKYQVQYRNRYYNAKCLANLKVDTIVPVLVPENNWSELIINIPCTNEDYLNAIDKIAELETSFAKLNSEMNDGKRIRAYTTVFSLGKNILAGEKNVFLDINIASLGFTRNPAVFCVIPCTTKFVNIRYIFDESTAQFARIAFDNDDAALAKEIKVRFSIIITE